MRISVAVRNSSAAVAAVILLMCTASYGQGWTGAVPIDNGETAQIQDGTRNGPKPQVAMYGNGNAVAVFDKMDPVEWKKRIYANRWNGEAWTDPVAIDAGTGRPANNVRLGVDASGNAVAVFDQKDGSVGQHGLLDRVYATRWDGASWTDPVVIDNEAAKTPGSYGSDKPVVAVGQYGSAVALFLQRTGAPMCSTSSRVYATWWNGTAWSGVTPLDIGYGATKSIFPQVAIGENGEAVAVFSSSDINRPDYQLYVNRWNGTAWTGAVLIDDGVEGNVTNPQVGVDGSGNAVVVFEAPDKNNYDLTRIYATRWNGALWSVPEVIDAGTGRSANGVRLGVDASGNAVVVFGQWDRGNILIQRVYATRWDGTAWTGAVPIDDKPSGEVHSYVKSVAVNASGHAVALFTRNDGGAWDRIYANRWDGTAWTGAELIVSGYDNNDPQVGIDASGNAMVVFTKYRHDKGDWEQVYANYFANTAVTPTETPTATPAPPNDTPEPTATPAPPKDTPEPTATPAPPKDTPEPTATPVVTEPPSPEPTTSPEPEMPRCMNLRVLNTLSGSAVTVAWSCNFTECDYAGVPVNVYLAAVSDSTVQRGTCSLEELMKSDAVYLFNPEMRGVYQYKGGVKAPTFKGVVFGEGFGSGEIMLLAPEGVLFRLAVVLVRTDTGELIGSDGSPVENSNAFIRLGAAGIICAE